MTAKKPGIIMERKLATIQKIVSIEPIEGADKIERVTVLGWHLVVKKGEFKIGDLCVYCEVDSLMPVKPEYEFLRKFCYNKRLDGFRIKIVKMRGQVSEGVALPLSIIKDINDFNEGDDVTELLDIRKYEAPIPSELSGRTKGGFPNFISKTDEIRIQSIPEILEQCKGEIFVVTEKVDGTSSTYYVNNREFGFCGRNWEFESSVQNTYSQVAKDMQIEDKLKSLNKNIAIQGEIIGPGIQGNLYKLTKHELMVFDIFYIDKYRYYNHNELTKICKQLDLKTVPIISENFKMEHTVDELVEFSNGASILNTNIKREGIVFRSTLQINDSSLKRLSFKVINPEFLLKYEK